MMMTDDELRALVQEKAPADLTPEECAALRAAVRTSPDLLREVADRIQIEEYLARALGRPQVSVERVLERLAARRARAVGRWTRYGLLVCGGVALLLVGLLASRGGRERPQPQQVARQEAGEPAAAVEEPAAPEAAAPSQPPPPEPAPPPPTEPVAPPPATVAAAATPTAEPLRELGLFEPAAADDATPDDKSLARWFAPVDKLPLKLASQPIDGQPCGRLEGIARLRRPLVDGAALRMASPDFTGVRIHVWSGEQGVSFAAFAKPLRWIANATTRSGTAPLPSDCVTLGLDDGRGIRTTPGGVHPLELRHADGVVTLARGDVRLVEAPLAGPPTDVVFEGAVTFRDVALLAALPIPPLRTPAARPAADLLADSRERWLAGGDPSAGFTVHDDGTATLAAIGTKQPAWAMLPLPEPTGLREIIVQIAGAMPGTGLVCGDSSGRPQSVLMVLANKHLPGALQLQRKPPNDAAIESAEQPATQPITFVRDGLWLRIRQCGGVQRFDTSADGRHWVSAAEPQPACSAIGLYAVPHPAARSITVAAVRHAPFSRLESLSPADLREAAVELPPQGPLATWLAAADAAKPPAAEAGAWRRACALKALAGSAPKDLAVDLLGFLFRESLDTESQPAARQDLLDDILAVAPVADDPAAAARVATLFDAIGARVAADGEPRCYSAISHEQLAAPLRSGQPFGAFSEPLARREIVGLLGRGEWSAAADLRDRLRFFGFTAKPRNDIFSSWAAAVAQGGREPQPPPLAAEWRHPLVVAPDKESLSVQAELNAALDGEDFADACRLFDAAAADGAVGLLQDRRDTDLFMTLPVVVATAMRDEPRLLETMRQDRERIAGLRVLEATAAGDEAAVEATTVQFHGTRAAAKAHAWLADRNLAAGRFTTAVRHYEATAATLPDDDGQQQERTRDAIDVARRLGAPPAAAAPPIAAGLLQAKAITATPQARLEGDVGVNPAALPAPLASGGIDWPPHALDWAARQIAVLPLADRLLVANRFQLASHDPATGAVQWRAGLGGDVAGAHDLPGQAMRPVADAARAYVRRLRKAGPAVAAIALADGAVAWELPSTPERAFVSDPLPADGNTLAICVARKLDEGFTLAFASLDAATGRLLREAPLVTLGSGWATIRDCQVAAADGLFVVAAGGAVITCDGAGRVRWVRREPWLPPAVDAAWMLADQSPPLVRDGRVHVVQPGVPGIVALDAASGRVLWRLADVSVSRLRGIARGRLVVERIGTVASAGSSRPGHADLVALDAATGAVAWRSGPADLLDASLVTDEGVLVAVREPLAEKNDTRIATLVRLDPATGRETGRWPLAACEDPQPCLGPLVPTAGGLHAFFGRGPADATRDLVLLALGAP